MYRKVGNEFGVNVKTTQTTQTTQTAYPFSNEDKSIFLLVKNNPYMSQREYAMELGWTVDRVKYYLRKLKTQKLISRVGNSHSGHWEVSADVSECE